MALMKYASFAVIAVENAEGSVLRDDRASGGLVKQAHRATFDYERRPGYIYVRSRAISSRTNDNFDMFPAEEIKAAWRTFIGKPVFVNHHNANHRRARGVIIDAALHEDTNPDGTPDTWVEVLMEVDAVRFPRLAEAVVAGDIARTSMGTDVAYSVCTACGNKAATPADYCAHIPKMKGMKIRRVTDSGQPEEVLIAERCYGLGFFEDSLLVEPPADPTAYVLGVDGEPVTAQQKAASIIDEAEQVTREAVSTSRTASRKQAASFDAFMDAPVHTRDLLRLAATMMTADHSQYIWKWKGYTSEQDMLDDFATIEDEYDRRVLLCEIFEESDLPLSTVLMRMASRTEAGKRWTKTSAKSTPAWHDGFNAGVAGGEFAPPDGVDENEQYEAGYEEGERLRGSSDDDWFNLASKKKDQTVPPSEHGDPRLQDAGVSVSKTEDGKYYVHTHRARGKRRDSVADIPDSEIKEIRATGGLHTAASKIEASMAAEAINQHMAKERWWQFKKNVVDPFLSGLRVMVDYTTDGRGNRLHGGIGSIRAYDADFSLAGEVRWDRSLSENQGIIDMRVPPPYRGRGIGQYLVDYLRESGAAPNLVLATASRRHAYGETKAPAEVDTLRADRCPVCNDEESFDGEKCAVCGHHEPPDRFKDPDLDKAKQVDLRQDKAEEGAPQEGPQFTEDPNGELECDQCGRTFAEGEPASSPSPAEDDADDEDPADDDAEDEDPEKAERRDKVAAEKPDFLKKKDDDSEDPEDDADPSEDASGKAEDEDEDEEPSDPSDATKICPVCGQGTLVPKEAPEKEPQSKEDGVDAMTEQQTAGENTNPAKQARNRLLAAVREQQQEIDMLRTAVRTLVSAAGMQRHPRFAALMRTSTDVAKTEDDPESKGATPGANDGVTPAAVTDAENSNVALPTQMLEGLEDVTKPMSGADTNPGTGTGDIRAESPSTDVQDPKGSSGWSTQSSRGEDKERFAASLRLARQRLAAGLDSGEDLTIAQQIHEGNSSLEAITVEASTLSSMGERTATKQPGDEHRHLVPQSSGDRKRVSFQRSEQRTASTSDEGEEFLFGADGIYGD